MPRTFPNSYTVPLSLDIDSPMTESDHVRYVCVVAPRNPLIEVATFHFVPQRSQPRLSTRIRLAEPQFVLAFAELSDRDAVDDQDLGRGRHQRLRLIVIRVRQKMVAPMPRVQVPSAATKRVKSFRSKLSSAIRWKPACAKTTKATSSLV